MLSGKLKTGKDRLSAAAVIAVLLFTLIAFIPFILAARYAVFSGDDFWIIVETMAETGSSYFMKSLQKAWHLYIYWQGDYFCNLLQPLLNPLRAYSFTQLRLTLITFLLMSFLSCLYMAYEAAKSLGIKNRAVYIFALLLLPVISYRDYTASYLWYVGTVAYQVSTILFCLSAGLILHCLREKSRPVFVLACIVTFLMTGGSLMVGAFASCILLVCLAAELSENKKLSSRLLTVFIISIIGNILHSVAPGNFARHGIIGDYNVLKAVTVSARLVFMEIGWMLSRPSFPLFLFLSFLVGFSAGKKYRPLTLIGVACGLVISIIVSLFPVVFGYNSFTVSVQSLSQNHIYALDIAVIFSCEIIAHMLGSQLCACGFIKKENVIRTAALVLSAVLLVPAIAGINTYIPCQIFQNLRNGKIQESSLIWRNNYEIMQSCAGEDVVITDIPEPCVGFHTVSFGSSPDSAINPRLTTYFGLNSVCDGYYFSLHNDQ